MFVSAFNSRPVIRIREHATQREYALTFADAVGKYGSLIKEENLMEAYKRAGTAFKFQMEQHFVVMKEHPMWIHQQGDQINRKRRIEHQETQGARGPSNSGSSRGFVSRNLARGGLRGNRGSKVNRK